MSFIQEFQRVQKRMYKISADHGFHDEDEPFFNGAYRAQVSQRLMLIVSELSEALEAIRNDNPPDSHIPKFTGVEAELADAVIRIMDLAETTQSRLGPAIIAKATYNNKREHKHGGKKF